MSNLDHGKRQTEKDDINHPITLLHRSLICNCHALTASCVCTSWWRRSIDSMLTDENFFWRHPDAGQICVSGGEQSRSSSYFISLCTRRRRSVVFIRRKRFVQKYQQFVRSRIYALTSSQQECAAKWSSKLNFSQSGNWTTSWQRSVSTVDGWNWREFAMNVRFALLDRKHRSRRAFANNLLSKEKHRWERSNTLNLFTVSESLPDEDGGEGGSACRDDRCVDLEKHSHERMQKSKGSPTSLHFRNQDRRILFD